MMTAPVRIGCIECDLLVSVAALAPGDVAMCPRCDHVLTENNVAGMTRSLAFAIAAGVLLLLSLSFPFLSLKKSGFEQVMTLPSSARALTDGGYPEIAVLVMGPIVAIPGAMVVGLGLLLLSLIQGVRASWLVPLGRALFFLSPWSMVEVFVIGVIVSLVKITSLATVIIGFSFWSYATFALCYTAAFLNVDRVQLWERIEELSP